jgi:hypothetical protein
MQRIICGNGTACDQDGTQGSIEHALGNAANPEAFQTAAALSSHGDEISANRRGPLQNRRARQSTTCHGFNRYVIAAQWTCQLVQLVQRIALSVVPVLGVEVRR